MSIKTDQILEKLKELTLLEASELVVQIEETFGVDASMPTVIGNYTASPEIIEKEEKIEEQTSFDVILEEVPNDKRVPVLKVIRNLTSLDLKQAKEAITDLPKTILEGVSKEESEAAKQQLEEAGGKIKIA
uniref:Large ribosomal subunit protein bL12c n=1 Tax=Prototheca cutis TaxID=575411 RepID=A0A2Z6BEP7_9CHLO|nr:ribosomal protein l12 [Prototheca cutis]BBD20206.1 ribosomal protein l12 [Prototheca cutis]